METTAGTSTSAQTGSSNGSASVTAEQAVTVSPPEPPKVDLQDVQEVALKRPIDDKPAPAQKEEVEDFYDSIVKASQKHDRDNQPSNGHHDSDEWDGKVRPWNPDWVRYDHQDRRGPVICNPYRDREIVVVYVSDNRRYVRVIPPMSSIFVEVNHIEINGFTATEVKVGVGGIRVVVNVTSGYFHGVDVPPPPVFTNVNVVVVVNQQYFPSPFVVPRVTYCGFDRNRGKDHFVFDNGYHAWGRGVWSQSGALERVDLEESARYPGLPGADPGYVQAPPEPYIPAAQVKNMAAEKPDGIVVSPAAIVLGTVGVGAIGGILFLLGRWPRRSKPTHI